MLSPEQSMQFTGMSAPKKKTHRGRRSKGMGSKENPGASDHHAAAKTHMANAQSASDPADARKHLFKALTSLNHAGKATVSQQGGDGGSMGNPIEGNC